MNEKIGHTPAESTTAKNTVLVVDFHDPTFEPTSLQEESLKRNGIGYVGTIYDRNLCPRRMILSGDTSTKKLSELGYPKVKLRNIDDVLPGLP